MSRIRTALATIGVLAVATTSLALSAPAATAASNPGLVTLTYVTSPWPPHIEFSTGSVRMNPGDSVTLHKTNLGPSDVTVDGTFVGTAHTYSGGDLSLTFSSLGTYSVCETYSSKCFTVNVVSEPVEAPPAHDYYQQVGVPASGNCADVPPHTGHWSGYPIGGWSKSWAWWINDGNGGPVCTREVEERPDGTIVLIG